MAAKKYRAFIDGTPTKYASQTKTYDVAVPAARDGKKVRVYEKENGRTEQLFETFNTGNHDRSA